MSFYDALSETGLALFTVVNTNGQSETAFGWVYPHCVAYSSKSVHEMCLTANLVSRELPWYHPRQKWYVASKKPTNLPSSIHYIFLRGAVLNVPTWKESTNINNL